MNKTLASQAYSGDQEQYYKLMLESIYEAANIIEKEENFYNLLKFLGKKRHEIAEILNQSDKDDFGIFRMDDDGNLTEAFTPFTFSHVALYLQKFINMCNNTTSSNIIHANIDWNDSSSYKKNIFKRPAISYTALKNIFDRFISQNKELNDWLNSNYVGCCIKNKLEKDQVCLTGFIKAFSKMPPFGKIEKEYKDSLSNEWNSVSSIYGKLMSHIESIYHPSLNKEQFDKILDTMQDIYDNIKINNNDNLFYNIGMLVWWVANTMPFIRGTASVINMLYKSILLFKNYNIDSLYPKYDIQIDLEAMITPSIEDFASKFDEELNKIYTNQNSDFFYNNNF